MRWGECLALEAQAGPFLAPAHYCRTVGPGRPHILISKRIQKSGLFQKIS